MDLVHLKFMINAMTLILILDVDVPRRASYGVYISQINWFAKVCPHDVDFNTPNKCKTSLAFAASFVKGH